MRREPGPWPATGPEERNGVEHTRWCAEKPTTYGYPLGAVEERGGLAVHNPFGFPEAMSLSLAAALARETRHARLKSASAFSAPPRQPIRPW
ncbi:MULTISPECIES: hypothetical protein [unclassified Corallococcus]|uniref:hypothetical protein n=1 Tax=unclassified Corallococcus TaxID=2685029 RepID=UPI001A8D86B8|nr:MULTISPECIES: hypothetical protein [unclassified Corallococcus]MBN9685173.1 hypothetical protein [Corallococcus sp. NCSPR001]WAS83369.1 hypothetical protein O0N60_29150 [Corallococcus sp. NCRR]